MSACPAHILLIEDDATTCRLVTMVLEEEGYAVTASAAPLAATRLVDQRSFDRPRGRAVAPEGGLS